MHTTILAPSPNGNYSYMGSFGLQLVPDYEQRPTAAILSAGQADIIQNKAKNLGTFFASPFAQTTINKA